ncbi:RNA polymerase sigma factor [Halobacillus litoralis]|uniref:RNA polymerase sigma factor SigS n=1 Tax=Halobacillus litoralis TaxID=45668 RepID=A0A410MFA8_9BACI|nr:sigma-70 family RNA polymerase sigma factor [Halobacillus litoralis]QAS53388.1 hypothetical protein HLI_14885 [Halobacillus litoralis]
MKTNIPIFHECEGLIYFTLRRLNIPEPHDDYFQEGYLIFRKSLEKYDSSLKSKFSTYFTHILYRHFQSHLRKEQREREATAQLSHNTPLKWSDPLLEPLILVDILHYSALTPLESSIFHFTYSGFTVRETAVLTERSVSTIKRARKRLKQKLEVAIKKV